MNRKKLIALGILLLCTLVLFGLKSYYFVGSTVNLGDVGSIKLPKNMILTISEDQTKFFIAEREITTAEQRNPVEIDCKVYIQSESYYGDKSEITNYDETFGKLYSNSTKVREKIYVDDNGNQYGEYEISLLYNIKSELKILLLYSNSLERDILIKIVKSFDMKA